MKIQFDKDVTFHDWTGAVVKVYKPGDTIEASVLVDDSYWVTAMGGVYTDEAHEVK